MSAFDGAPTTERSDARTQQPSVPRMVHYVAFNFYGEPLRALCGAPLVRKRSDNPAIDCVVCQDLHERGVRW